MTAESLAGALGEALDPEIASRARALAQQIGENGAEVAARRLEVEYGAS
jgi:hypothetical protein